MNLLPINNIKSKDKSILTLSTCWYILKSKFNVNIYLHWIKNLLSIVNNFNLVIYTNVESFLSLRNLIDIKNKKIKIIIKPLENFYLYKYKNNWILNHNNSKLELHNHINWNLNMLWNEKVFFVNETIKNKYFDTLYYGWCDIGYFRNRSNDLNTKYLTNWPSKQKLLKNPFIQNQIHYGCIQNKSINYLKLSLDIRNHYNGINTGHPCSKFDENCFSGGFFLLKPDLIDNYTKLYEQKLLYYFENKYIIKDDQTIIMDIIFNNSELFYIHTEDFHKFDNWFMFQRILF